MRDDAIVLDARLVLAFGGGHIPEVISCIALGSQPAKARESKRRPIRSYVPS